MSPGGQVSRLRTGEAARKWTVEISVGDTVIETSVRARGSLVAVDRRTARSTSATPEWIAQRGVVPMAPPPGELVSAASGARVADLGCGPGWYAALLRRRGFEWSARLARAMLRGAYARGASPRGRRSRPAALRARSLDAAGAQQLCACSCQLPGRSPSFIACCARAPVRSRSATRGARADRARAQACSLGAASRASAAALRRARCAGGATCSRSELARSARAERRAVLARLGAALQPADSLARLRLLVCG
jgi:hypothetical protein